MYPMKNIEFRVLFSKSLEMQILFASVVTSLLHYYIFDIHLFIIIFIFWVCIFFSLSKFYFLSI